MQNLLSVRLLTTVSLSTKDLKRRKKSVRRATRRVLKRLSFTQKLRLMTMVSKLRTSVSSFLKVTVLRYL